MAYLLPASVTGPQTLSLSDALSSPGWFIVVPGLKPAQIDSFVSAAQVYFANSARAGAFAAWFQNIENPAVGLSAMVVYAARSGAQAVMSRSALIQGANLSINMDSGSIIAVSEDGLSLSISGSGNSWSVTPFGSRQPYQLPWLSGGAINVLGPSATAGCFQFLVSVSDAAAEQLDVGLRSYTAPVGGGYTQSASHRFLNFGTSGILLDMTLDPLTPLDHLRSFAGFSANQSPLASTYRTAVGETVSLAPAASASLVFTDRLLAVDSNGNPVVLSGNKVVAMTPSGDFTLSLPVTKQVSLPGSAPNLSATLMCGLSAVEYLDVNAAATLNFVPDQPAFAATLKAATGTGPSETKRVFGPLTGSGQTSWAYLSVNDGSTYFAQPDSSVLHNGPGDTTSPFLNYLPVELGVLPPSALRSNALGEGLDGYPLLPYAGVTVGVGLTTDDISQFEMQAWAPKRKALIQQAVNLSASRLTASAATLPSPPFGTTPKACCLSSTRPETNWAGLT
ncbi:hypothetical protein [Pseudomonas sp. DC1.2]|uniref:hypothetical protein n=1 Tax=Pseudomonas sp. DC1.2 TaxID=3048622 RepID=UPI002AC910B7|nr:hypothetical protein [Pseudomonas sp. DC1.2]WPX61510.1 hypothetical protein RHM68_13025 [Pseudomonas sp. DC1.2]